MKSRLSLLVVLLVGVNISLSACKQRVEADGDSSLAGDDTYSMSFKVLPESVLAVQQFVNGNAIMPTELAVQRMMGTQVRNEVLAMNEPIIGLELAVPFVQKFASGDHDEDILTAKTYGTMEEFFKPTPQKFDTYSGNKGKTLGDVLNHIKANSFVYGKDLVQHMLASTNDPNVQAVPQEAIAQAKTKPNDLSGRFAQVLFIRNIDAGKRNAP